jgi:hypothetical protein
MRREVTGRIVLVLAFKTAYTLQQKRRDNDKKVISLYVGMRDMVGVLFLSVFPSIYRRHTHISQLNGRGT